MGYQGQVANASRNTMMTPTFLNVGSDTGCKLSDLTVTGYEAPEWNEEDECSDNGCGAGEFILQFLNANGTVASKYYWIDDGDHTAGWYASTAAAAIDGGATSVNIPAGTAAWVIGTGKTLQTAGQVGTEDIAFVMNATRNTAAGNATPVDLTLAKLTVSGYEAPEWNDEDECYDNGCGAGEFILQFLNANGSVASKYYWIDDGDHAAGWYASTAAAAIDGGASSVNIPAGKGAWVIGTGKTLNIPAPELN